MSAFVAAAVEEQLGPLTPEGLEAQWAEEFGPIPPELQAEVDADMDALGFAPKRSGRAS